MQAHALHTVLEKRIGEFAFYYSAEVYIRKINMCCYYTTRL